VNLATRFRIPTIGEGQGILRMMAKGSALFALGISLLTAASATTVIPMSIEQLTETSTHVVLGHVVKTWSSWDAQHTRISTYTQMSVENWLKGTGENAIIVKQPGGSAEGYTQHVSGVRPWSAGESAVLFLHRAPSNDGTYVVSGLMQGDFRVRRSTSGAIIADNGVSSNTKELAGDVQSFNPSNKSLTPYTGSHITLDELEQRVRAAIRSR
jgi:hypothetical protein